MATQLSDQEAARFLAHATLGYTRSDINSVKSLGYEGWLNAQFAIPRLDADSHWNWVTTKRPAQSGDGKGPQRYDFVDSIWRKFFGSTDLLRHKTAFALSQILVASAEQNIADWQQFPSAHYMDILEKHAFGNYRNLLTDVSLSPMMGHYLTYIGSKKAGRASANSQPDENYARELLQLFTLGVALLEMDGSNTPNPDGSDKEIPSYSQADIQQLARVFTGWTEDKRNGADMRAYGNLPLYVPISADFDNREKSVDLGGYGFTIARGLSAKQNLKQALDGIFAHPNVAPFVSRQLIQRFVTSNPAPDYIERVAQVFIEYPGNMKRVLKAVLLDQSLFDADGKRLASGNTFGKLREPVACVVQWARAFKLKSLSNNWLIAGREKALGLEQIPMRSPSVFNFFRPGYVAPGTLMDQQEPPLVTPEFQIANEASVISYLNFMHVVIDEGLSTDVVPDYDGWSDMATRPMIDEMNIVLACGQLSPPTVNDIVAKVGTMSILTDLERKQRVKAAAMLVVSSPEFLVLK